MTATNEETVRIHMARAAREIAAKARRDADAPEYGVDPTRRGGIVATPEQRENLRQLAALFDERAAALEAPPPEPAQLKDAQTPPPWMVDDDGEVFPVGAEDGEPIIAGEIAVVVSANAKDRPLIAAAPELADALAEALEQGCDCAEWGLDATNCWHVRARAALRKAGRQ